MGETDIPVTSSMSPSTTEVKEKVWKKYAAEFIGTFVLVFMGCGSAVIAGYYIGFQGVAFAFGLSVLVMVYAIGGISGCHINPAVSISMLVRGKITAKNAVAYIIAQCVGAIVGAGVLYLIVSGRGPPAF